MTIPVDLSELAEAVGRYRSAYLLTASHRGAPPAVARIAPARAVLHRPALSARPAAPGACGSDCVELA